MRRSLGGPRGSFPRRGVLAFRFFDLINAPLRLVAETENGSCEIGETGLKTPNHGWIAP